jgi:hypothetical protein
MRTTRTLSTVTNSDPVMLDWLQASFAVAIGCVATGTVNYKVQHTFDDQAAIAANTATWFDHSSLVNKTASSDGNYAFPVTAVRLVINSGTPTYSVVMTVIQGRI